MIYNLLVLIRNKIIRFFYKLLLKPLFFLQDPESIHDKMLKVGQFLGKFAIGRFLTKIMFGYKNKGLVQEIDGVKYNNPIGLAAGFDKNAQLTEILPEVGFGFEEIGSITGESCPGNEGRRLWRLPKSKSLVVYYGLMNDGAKALSKRLKGNKFKIPVGVSIAKTNSKATVGMQNGINDYVKAYTRMKDIGDYVTINISCPNAFGGQPFTDKKSLGALLAAINAVRIDKPHYIKLSPDLSKKQTDDIVGLGRKYKISGFITSNLTKSRDNKNIVETEIPENGGLSGKVVQELANKQLAYIRKKTGNEFTLIGCGGIFTANDAYEKILNGASLLQMITGMIYMGPQQIGEINRGLAKLLKRDGYLNISEAVGKAIDK